MVPMSLEMRERCERCALPLPADGEAFICSFECTYCPACAAATARCPTCEGELTPRPRRIPRARAETPIALPTIDGEASQIVEADLDREDHRRAVLELTDAYARDPMGSGKPLPAEVRDALAAGLRRHPTTLILLAYQDGQAVGLATCFLGFSTFFARPLVNIHDLMVLPGQRSRGVGRDLLRAVETRARALGCCKVTLEVFENNQRARRVYAAAGFAQASYTAEAGGALYLAKPL
jgi:GNAT superfamily N-acetyltransferase